MTFPVLCMDCGAVCGQADVEGSTGLCGICPRSRERLGDDDGKLDYDPVIEDTDD
ncbi:MAG TPA: hypothetical protein VJP77_09910 [Planctomycetota bacterium]|nr:hypothetical protein [Planctomycetota bacterium]